MVAGAAVPFEQVWAEEGAAAPGALVAIARDDALLKGEISEHADLLCKMLDASMQKLTKSADAASAWRKLFKPTERIGIKVNCLGRTTQPAVVDAIVAGLRQADVPAENIVIWDRFDSELERAGFKLNKSGKGVQCRGTDASRLGGGYQRDVQTSGKIGSCFSKILAERIDALISAPVLKDHGIAGASLGMKNFYGAIHNPNKYHGNRCDPYIADIVRHPFIRDKWRLTVCDGTLGQYEGGPMRKRAYDWRFGGMITSTDFVALDAVGVDYLEKHRAAQGMESLADAGRPPTYIATAGAQGLGVSDLKRIERIEV